jgi:hypothetical protein
VTCPFPTKIAATASISPVVYSRTSKLILHDAPYQWPFITQIRFNISASISASAPMSQSYRYVIAQPTSINTSLHPPYHD